MMATTCSGLVFIVASLLIIDRGVGLRLLQDGSHEPYFWSSGRGSVGSYSASSYPVTANISAPPTWSWHHPNDLWATVPVGTSIDDQKNVYLTVADGIRKFSPDGQLLWTYTRRESGTYKWETITKVAALMDGVAYGITQKGRAFAVSMDTGRELWSTNVSRLGSDGNYGHVAADAGVVITAAEVSKKTNRATPSCCGPMNHKVVGLSGADGSILWTYEPEIPVWNFGASFAGDGTFIFQSLDGTVYRNKVSDGTLVWKAGGVPESWTDGQANLGPNGIVYGVANYKKMGPEGCISAHRLSDGKMLWRHDLPTSPNAVPAVSRVAGYPGLSVVIPVGVNDVAGQRIDVYALDAETGKQRWVFEGPTQTVSAGAGDIKGPLPRLFNHVQPMTMPNSWGCTAIDGQGKVFVGGTTGHFFELQDADADGKVVGPGEVSVMETPADFVGSSGPAIAPGLLAIGNANSLFVWKY
mmetsp:Transcript_4134/g.12085  ORF Transcript_4134/g.12085 Transcript_4134/m.12085 type:complete len:469 (+) Transcript_4134:68-1474(+)